MMKSHKYTNSLIIANGASCSNELLEFHLQNNDLIIVLDSAMKRVAKLNIKVDVLIGDFDRDFDTEIYKKQYPELLVKKIDNQNTTDLEKAFLFLREYQIERVNVIWGTGKRMDHTLNNITCIANYHHDLDIHFYDDYSHIFILPKMFEKEYIKNTIISLLPIGTVGGITTQNLTYPLINEELVLGFRSGSSNSVKSNGLVKISYSTGFLLMMECND